VAAMDLALLKAANGPSFGVAEASSAILVPTFLAEHGSKRVLVIDSCENSFLAGTCADIVMCTSPAAVFHKLTDAVRQKNGAEFIVARCVVPSVLRATCNLLSFCRCNGLKICDGQASAVASMVRVDSMIGEVMAVCTPGTVVCLMVASFDLQSTVCFSVIFPRLAPATANMRATLLQLLGRAASQLL
jgi:hypothetical protein